VTASVLLNCDLCHRRTTCRVCSCLEDEHTGAGRDVSSLDEGSKRARETGKIPSPPDVVGDPLKSLVEAANRRHSCSNCFMCTYVQVNILCYMYTLNCQLYHSLDNKDKINLYTTSYNYGNCEHYNYNNSEHNRRHDMTANNQQQIILDNIQLTLLQHEYITVNKVPR